MSCTKTSEYRDLERESSNDLMEYDSKRVLGRDEEAAYHALQAAQKRVRMGQLCFDAEEYEEAVEDWLSAAKCYHLANARELGDVLDVLHRLETDERIPADREDLKAAVRQRDQELKTQGQQVRQFYRSLAAQGHQVDQADERTLDFLLQCVRDLPGLSMLHYAIFRQASALGRQEIADRHLVWAADFDPMNPNYAALLGYRYIVRGQPGRAAEIGTNFLAIHTSDIGPVRIMLANALASGETPNREQALEILRPLIEGREATDREQVAALALSAAFCYELGQEQGFGRFIHELERLENVTEDPELRNAIGDFRRIIPTPDAIKASSNHLNRRIPETDRLRLFEKATQVSLQSRTPAA